MGHVETEVLRPGCLRWAAAQGWAAPGGAWCSMQGWLWG